MKLCSVKQEHTSFRSPGSTKFYSLCIYCRCLSHVCTFFVSRHGFPKQITVPMHGFLHGLSLCLVGISDYTALNGRMMIIIIIIIIITISWKECCRRGLGPN